MIVAVARNRHSERTVVGRSCQHVRGIPLHSCKNVRDVAATGGVAMREVWAAGAGGGINDVATWPIVPSVELAASRGATVTDTIVSHWVASIGAVVSEHVGMLGRRCRRRSIIGVGWQRELELRRINATSVDELLFERWQMACALVEQECTDNAIQPWFNVFSEVQVVVRGSCEALNIIQVYHAARGVRARPKVDARHRDRINFVSASKVILAANARLNFAEQHTQVSEVRWLTGDVKVVALVATVGLSISATRLRRFPARLVLRVRAGDSQKASIFQKAITFQKASTSHFRDKCLLFSYLGRSERRVQ